MTQDEAVEIIGKAFEVPVTAQTTINEVAGDSLDFLFCLNKIESLWGQEFTDDEELTTLETVGDLADLMVSQC